MIRGFYLVTRPEHDETTRYLSQWCKFSIDLANKKDMKVIDLHLHNANIKEVESRLRKLNPKLVMFNGHGDENFIAGHKNQPLISLGKNEELLTSKIVYALSCKSAKSLGLKSVKAGAISYTGFEDDFFLVFEPEKFSRPLIDKTAKMFLEPSNLFIQSLIKGNSVGESFEKSKKMMRDNFKISLSKDTDISRFLWWNIHHFKTHGNFNGKV